MKKTIKFEGFADFNSGAEFGLPIIMVSPKRLITEDHGNIGGAESMIEDFILDLDIGDIPKHDPYLKKSLVDKDLQRAKKGSKRFRRWSAIVEYDSEDENLYKYVKRQGF